MLSPWRNWGAKLWRGSESLTLQSMVKRQPLPPRPFLIPFPTKPEKMSKSLGVRSEANMTQDEHKDEAIHHPTRTTEPHREDKGPSKMGWKWLPGNPTFNLKKPRSELSLSGRIPQKQIVSTYLGPPKCISLPGTVCSWELGDHHGYRRSLRLSSWERQTEKGHCVSQMNCCFCDSRMSSDCARVMGQNRGPALFQGWCCSSFYQ